MSTDNERTTEVEQELNQPELGGIRGEIARQNVANESTEVEETPVVETKVEENQKQVDSEDDLPYGVKKRLKKMTADKYSMLDEIQTLKNELENIKQNGVQKQQQEVSPQSFKTQEDYLSYVAKVNAQQALQDLQKQQQEQYLRQQQVQSAQQEWQNKIDSQKESMADWNEVMDETDLMIDKESATLITESDLGPRILYHLAKNPDDVAKLKSLSSSAKNRYIAKMEFKLESEIAQSNPVVSKAPSPTPKTTGKASSSKKMDDDSISVREWMNRRNKQRYG
jgi:hypothetical protein